MTDDLNPFPDQQSELEYLQWQQEELGKDIQGLQGKMPDSRPQQTASTRLQKSGLREGQSMMNVAALTSPWALNSPNALTHPAVLAGADDAITKLTAERSDKTMTMETPWSTQQVAEQSQQKEPEEPALTFGQELVSEAPLFDRMVADAANNIAQEVQQIAHIEEPER